MAERIPVIEGAQLEVILTQVLTHESATIREAEAAIRKAQAQPAFLVDLFEQIRLSKSPQVRQLAAVLMRRRIAAHWTKLDPLVHQQMQAALLPLLTSEPERLVQRSIASVASVIARYALPKGAWPELFGFLFQCSQSETPSHRELSMLLLTSLLESELALETTFKPHFQLLATTLKTLLGDHANPPVRRAALKAVGAWAQALDEEENGLLKPLLAPILDVCVQAGSTMPPDEDTLCQAFGIL